MIAREDIGAAILEYRGQHQITQIEMANLCNVSVQTLNSVENGRQIPSKLTAAKISKVIEN